MVIAGTHATVLRSPHFKTIALFAVLSNLLIIAPSLHMLQVYDRVLSSHSLSTLLYLTLATLLALAVWGYTDFVRQRVATRLAASYTVSVAPKLFATLCRPQAAGNTLAQGLRDFTAARTFLGGRGFVALFDVPFVPLYVILMLILHWSLGLVTAIGVVVMCVLGWLNIAATEADREKSREADSAAMGFAQSALGQGELVRAGGLQSTFLSIWGQKIAEALRRSEQAGAGSAFYQAAGKSFRQALQVLIMALGALLVLRHEMSAGMIFMSSMISGKALSPIDQFIAGWEQTSRGVAAIRDIDKVIGPNHSISERMRLPAPRAILTASQIVHAPDSKRPSAKLLDGIDLTVAPGECVLVTGPIGAGKSTLLRILAGAIEPTAGRIAVDGVDRNVWPSAQWGKLIGYVPQHVDLFPGTIAINIARFDSEIGEAAVVDAARRADLHDAILALPDGYRTQVGGGFDLSVGQRQKVAIARAFLGQPNILILDEPNASLDQTGEAALLSAIQAAKLRGAAVVIAAHRASILRVVDRAFTLSEGRLKPIVDATRAAASPSLSLHPERTHVTERVA